MLAWRKHSQRAGFNMVRKPPSIPESSRESGFALVVVLWLAVLVALVAAVFTNAVRSRLRETAARASLLQAEALADAGVRIGILALLNPDPNAKFAPRYQSASAAITCAVPDAGVLTIEIEDEEGKVNLNTSNDALLMALFSGLGASDAEARAYSAKILDFRDADDEARPDGAERQDYEKAKGLPAGPKNGDFIAVSELDQVVGLPPELRERAKPFLTTFSQQNGVDAARMPKGLAEILERGARVATTSPGLSNGKDLPASFLAVSSKRAFMIRPEAFTQSGARYSIEAIVQLPDTPNGVPLMRQWQRSTSRLSGPADAVTRGNWPPC